MSSIELVSFKLCPFVQRSIITLKYKNIDFEVTYINLEQPPEWFAEISPLGQVPVLKTAGEVLFESAVINEYLDEITPPSLHPSSSLEKAKHRAWIEFGSSLLFQQFNFYTATTKEQLAGHKVALLSKLQHLEKVVADNGFFNGEQFSLVDTAYAPLFMRFDVLSKRLDFDVYAQTPKIKTWAANLLTIPAVQQSVVEDFPQLFDMMLTKRQSFLQSNA